MPTVKWYLSNYSTGPSLILLNLSETQLTHLVSNIQQDNQLGALYFAMR